ncbi:hypothetical protein K1T71_008712 [Dendrolimus kikuchii]|uniref:Uncharacterized protein n=1 Tax=Dendrolimus kikuchii TaxID=765133 RepID=A0ACC1CV90_9NEOP|nr:hypothetical protein K1T71_008712 [Dendrolimus kikuchii]
MLLQWYMVGKLYHRSHIKYLYPSRYFGNAMSASGSTGNTSRGVPLCEIYGSQSPWGSPEFPLVVPSYNHAVLYHVPGNGALPQDRPPKPQIGQDKWDHDFVRMPCSVHSLYPVNDNGESHLKKRWEIIESSLSKPIKNSQELADTILSYNTKFRNIWKFRALCKLFDEYLEEEEVKYFFDVTLPEIAKLALALPKLIQTPIPLLKQHKNRSISLSQQQISSLLANAFFCTFPRRNTTKKSSEYASYPHINFNMLYESSPSDSTMEKLKCVCYYFKKVTTKVPVGVLTFSRRSVPQRDCPRWVQSDAHISDLPLHIDSVGTIEDADGLIQIDFANKYLGGGVLGHGCVQEEIRFVICPELMISMLFTEVLSPSEVLFMIGCERYSKYTGYANTFQWAGDFKDTTPHDSSGRKRCAVLAMDALPYSNVVHEFKRVTIARELNKAWIGFSYGLEGNSHSQSCLYPGVATGNWGCGAFGGSEALKSIVQIMAGAHSRRPIAYYTFGDSRLRDFIINIYNMLVTHDVTVGQLYKLLLNFCLTDVRKNNLQTYIRQALQNEANISKNNSENATNEDCAVDNKPEGMAINTSSVISQLNLEECFKDDMSPDLFSQDETELLEVKVDKDKNTESKETEKTERKSVPNQTSRLFDEMQKLDCEIGQLHSLSSPSQKRLTPNNENSDNSVTSTSSEQKKVKNRKITDYFSRM